MARYGSGYGWKPYVSVAERRRRGAKKLDSLRKRGLDVQPIEIEGRKIAKTFWGAAWCEHMESFSDYANRLPRGRTYVRNGSVCHLSIAQGAVKAHVAGSDFYTIKVQIEKLSAAKWGAIKRRSAGKIGSLLELLQGKLSEQVMQIVTDRQEGLFPLSNEITFRCDCPDWAGMCKHVAAVMYGIGARLDASPDLLFTLRGVDHDELIAVDAEAAVAATTTSGKSKQLAASDLSDVFGIELDSGDSADLPTAVPPTTSRKRATTKKRGVKKAAKGAGVKRKSPAPKHAAQTTAVETQRKAVKKKKK